MTNSIKDEVAEMVTVVIACYNHGKYLNEAIESVLSQCHKNVEIIVVDDGSADNTKDVARRYPVKYVYQSNQGLSAARNKGLEHSSGEYIIFLDADDWLLPDAISNNLSVIRQNSKLAFVSGGHEKVYNNKTVTNSVSIDVSSEHFRHLLEGNYIGMHAAVMYRRFSLENIKFDVSLKACEDYDVYLKIARNHPVMHHTKSIAAYRFHDVNMSGNRVLMLTSALKVLNRQKINLSNKEERKSFNKGLYRWQKHYTTFIYAELLKSCKEKKGYEKEKLTTLLQYNKVLYFKLLLKTLLCRIKAL